MLGLRKEDNLEEAKEEGKLGRSLRKITSFLKIEIKENTSQKDITISKIKEDGEKLNAIDNPYRLLNFFNYQIKLFRI